MWPKSYYPDCVVISPFSWESTESYQMIYGATGIRDPSSSTFSGGVRSMGLWPFSLYATYTPLNFFMLNGATAIGNLDVGIYTNDGSTTAQQIWHAGSTAQTGTSVLQTWAISNVELGPGNYYLALVSDNASSTVFAVGASNGITPYAGRGKVSLGSLPMPATVTLGAASLNWPLIGITNRSVV